MKTIDIEEFLRDSGIELRTLEQWVEWEWIVPTHTAARMQLSHADAARATLIRDLGSDLGVNDEGVDIVLHLIDQLHGLRRALLDIRMELSASPRDAHPDPEDGTAQG